MAEPPVTAQRLWRAACPNCGAPVEFASSASASAVCSFCRSTLLREGEVLRRTGESAELFADYSPLQVGTQGRHQGEPFTILGRIQLSYEGGSWNEWHAFFDNSGKSAWLSEDNGRFVLSWPLEIEGQAPILSNQILGSQQIVNGQSFRVAARTASKVHAAEGELPQAPRLGQPVEIVELRSARDEVGSLEYLESKPPPRWSLGKAVELASLQLSNLRDESVANWQGRSLQCPNCGAAIQPALGTSKSITCGQCQAVVELGDDPHSVQFHQQAIGLEPPIPLGRTGSISLDKGGAKAPWQVVGFMERCSSPDDEGEQYFWREYLLFNKSQGFSFLVDASDGWSLVRVLTGAPEVVMNSARWQGQTYALQERYTAVTTHVLGEFYWKVVKDERGGVTDFKGKDGQVLSREQSGSEITWSLGRRLDVSEIAKAFGLDPTQKARMGSDAKPTGNLGDTLKGLLIFGVIALLLVGLIRACTSDDCEPYKTQFGAESLEYKQCRASHRSSSSYSSGSGSGGWSGGGGGHK